MRAYKGFRRDENGTLWCRDMKYEVGKTYNFDGEIEICRSGFHACHNLYQTWMYYPNNGENAFYEVECGGDIVENYDSDGKFVCSEITLIKEIDTSKIIKFDRCWAFLDELGAVAIFSSEKGRFGFINKEGKLMFDQLFEGACSFSEGFAAVRLNGKENYINKEGKLLSDKWFDDCGYFDDGFASVELNGKWNFINTEGKLLSENWFDYCGDFKNGVFHVELNGKDNYINTEGKLLSDKWFDWGGNFKEGFACVKLNNKYNYINTEGKIISETWFDWGDDFCHGFASVKLNDKWKHINSKGKVKF